MNKLENTSKKIKPKSYMNWIVLVIALFMIFYSTFSLSNENKILTWLGLVIMLACVKDMNNDEKFKKKIQYIIWAIALPALGFIVYSLFNK